MSFIFQHPPITTADFLANTDYHISRLAPAGKRTPRGDVIPVVDATLPGRNKLLCELTSLSVFRAVSRDADERLLNYYWRYHEQDFGDQAFLTNPKSPHIPEGFVDMLKAKRLELGVNGLQHGYFYTPGQGFIAAFSIMSAEEDLSHLAHARCHMLILSPSPDSWHRQYLGTDIRPKDEVATYGDIPDSWAA